MIYNAIVQLENNFDFFNRKKLSPTFLLSWLSSLGYTTLPDLTLKQTFLLPKERIVIYDPQMHPDELTVALGHEIGHILLGHVDYYDVLFHPQTYFSKSGLEKDAGIVGFLCWLPTSEVAKLYHQERLSPEELAWEFKTCDTEWELLWKLCRARIRIFEGLLRIQKKCKGGGNHE
ncbi:MAG: ImmA/IrrE family metallo-endopeptidase [Nanopusillaceae archaeon]